jgi:hypothetical protein
MSNQTEQKVGTKIRNRTAGDNWTIRRNVVRIPTGQTIVKAWFTVKLKLQDDDPGILQKIITSVNQAGVGQIEDAGGSGTAIVRFDLTPADTVLFAPWQTYYYDIQVKTNLDHYDTSDDGTIIAKPQVTTALDV